MKRNKTTNSNGQNAKIQPGLCFEEGRILGTDRCACMQSHSSDTNKIT